MAIALLFAGNENEDGGDCLVLAASERWRSSLGVIAVVSAVAPPSSVVGDTPLSSPFRSAEPLVVSLLFSIFENKDFDNIGNRKEDGKEKGFLDDKSIDLIFWHDVR